MRISTRFFSRGLLLCLFMAAGFLVRSQTTPVQLKIKDFAIWAGGGPATTCDTLNQGLRIFEKATITGTIGSQQYVWASEKLKLTGSIYSGNLVYIREKSLVTGSITANKTATTFPFPAFVGREASDFKGDITANGRAIVVSGSGSNITYVRGKVAVPAPTSTNYFGPTPAGGTTNTYTLPILPILPNNSAFDSQIGTTTVSGTQTISPGLFKKMALSGNKTLTFNGPGNYIFNEVANSGTNKMVFSFGTTATGTINIFIIKDASWGKISVSMTGSGAASSRVYTEIHGTGSTNGGFTFNLQGPDNMPSNNYAWLGNIWAPNGGISIKNLKSQTNPHIRGAVWSGKKVEIKENLVLTYQAPANDPNFIDPYYPPPTNGKVNTANNTLGAELYSLSQNPAAITTVTDNNIFQINTTTNKVLIEVISKTANDNVLKGQLITLGLSDTVNNGPHSFVVTGYFPIANLTQLNTNTRIDYVRPLYPPLQNAGQVTSQGDKTMRSNFVRDRFGVDGSGVKIGVLSDSYNNKQVAQNDVDQGDLPGVTTSGQPNANPEPVQVLQDLSGGGNDEGRAMLQIVHDVAPKAKLAFRTGFITAGDFARGILALADPNLPGGRCDVIVDDLSYLTEPFLQDGIVAKTVNDVAAQGVTYVTSAGNFGTNSYESVFSGVTNTSLIATGQIHKYGTTNADLFQTVSFKPGNYTLVLQWADNFYSLGTTGAQNDLDLYIVGTNGITLFGFNRSNLNGDPVEVCPFTVKEETTGKIMVVRSAGTANVRFKYMILRGEATIQDYKTGTSTIVGHANSASAITVGAMLYDNVPPFTPIWPGVASFSSRGGTNTLQSNSFVVRNKPDLIAPNGVNTTVNLGGASSFNDGDPYPNFFGTSAAAPHVGGVAALLIQARKKFALQATVTPTDIRQQLITSAGKFSYLPAGFSFEGGNGYVQADSAVQQTANARPIIDTLMTTIAGAQNGTQPFELKVKGRYLTPQTQIYANGAPVTTTVSADKTMATATVPAIPTGQDPPYQLYNPAKSTSNLDGGLSEALHFFSSRVDVTIKAKSKSRKFGLENPGFDADVFINGIPIQQTSVTLAALKLDGANLSFTTIATPSSPAGLYAIVPSRTTPLANNDPLLTQYGFTFVSGTLTIEKMLLKITPQPLTLKYGEFPSNVEYTYELDPSAQNAPTLLGEIKALHKKYLADNALVVLNSSSPVSASDVNNMSVLASMQSLLNARRFKLVDGLMQPVTGSLDPAEIGNQRLIVDASGQSIDNYKLDSASTTMLVGYPGEHARAFLNLKALANGAAKAAVPNGQLQPLVNGQLMAMVNGQLQAIVNGQLQALVNGQWTAASDMSFLNGQLLALVNGSWYVATNGQLQAIVNSEQVTLDLSIVNGQLQAIVNGQLMALVNGQLQAIVNGQLLAVVNGQLKATVNGQLMPIVNGQLMAIVNGQLQPLVNGQLVAMVNGQLMALVNGELELIQSLSYTNGQLQALVNGQLQAIVNGQLKAMVNGVVTDVPTDALSLVNGQLQAIVNGQLVAMVNGQLQAIVNGQLQPLVNGTGVATESVRQLTNGQLQAIVNGTWVPITNGQLMALVNGQLLAMVNGQLMAIVNGELTFAVFKNGQLQALVNGQLQPLVNGQLQAIVNGQLQAIVNYSITNGQLQAIVNGQTWAYANGQLLAIVNGQLQPLVNNFDVSGSNNNSRTIALVDQDDINLQSGDLGAMFAVNMISGLSGGAQTLIPGAFVNENYQVTYGTAQVTILPSPAQARARDTSRVYGANNPNFVVNFTGLAYGEDQSSFGNPPTASTTATQNSSVGVYPITLSGGSSSNYSIVSTSTGNLTVLPAPLLAKADDKSKLAGDANPALTISYTGLIGDDNADSICIPYLIPSSPKVIDQLLRTTTYSDVKLNGGTNVILATPGQAVTLTGTRYTVYNNPTDYCPGCITQLYIGMANAPNLGNVFTNCYDVSLYSLTEPGISQTAALSFSFNAPTVPGVYYITQNSSWEYNCYDGTSGQPGNDPNNAIAVVVVGVGQTNITASTTADEFSVPGLYPITLQGCFYYNPNYTVSLQNGTLEVVQASYRVARNTTPATATAAAAPQATTAAAQTTPGAERTILPPIKRVDKLYPNPANTTITVQVAETLRSTADLEVFDRLGRISAISFRMVSEGVYTASVASLPRGIYLVKVKAGSGSKTFKFIKM